MFVRCQACGRIILKDDESAAFYNGYHYCSCCTVVCAACGETIPVTHAHPVEDSDALYCADCFEDETYRCHDCGRHYRYEDSVHYCDDEYYRCDDCRDSMGSVLDDYHSFKDYGHIYFLGKEKRAEKDITQLIL